MSGPRNVAPFSSHIGGKYTMTGVIQDYFDELVTRYWDEKTKKGYLNDYRKIILPHLSNCPFEEYEFEGFDKAIHAIQDNHIKKKGCGQEYAVRTMRHFCYLIRIVVQKAVEEGILKFDVLWGSYFSLTKNDLDKVTSLKNELMILPKSLSVIEDINAYQELCIDYKMSGP